MGLWKILGIATLPWFRHDEGVLNYGVRTDNYFNLPPGPNNPETIGRAGSHGCIRTANWDAARIKDLVTKGNMVLIY